MKSKSKLSKRNALLAAASVAGCVQIGRASNLSWGGNGGDANFSTAANWIGNVAPQPGDSLFFNGLNKLNPNNDYAAGTTFSGITFNTAGSFTLGGNAITLQGGITDNSSAPQTIALPVTYNGIDTVTASSSATLNLGAINRGTTGVVNFTLPSGAIVTTTSTDSDGILGGWATVGESDFAANDGSGNVVAYTGYTNAPINSILHGAIDPAANLQINQTGTVIIDADNAASTTDINTILQRDLTDANIKIGVGNTLRLGQIGAILVPTTTVFASNPWTISASGVGSLTQGNATLTAGGAPNTAGEIIINTNGVFNNSNVSIDANIADNGSGTVTVIKTGPGAIKFRGHNTYSGGTYIENGRLQFAGQEDSGGSAIGEGFGTGPVYISPGAQFYDSDNATIPNDFYIAGVGVSGQPVGALRIRNSTLSGMITLTGDTTIGNGGTGTTSNSVTFTGQITDAGKGYNLTFTADSSSSLIVLDNTSANPNNWSGNTTTSPFLEVLRLGASEQIPDGPGKGNLTLNNVLNLNGFSETVNGLSGGGVITNSATSTFSTFTVGSADQSGTYTGSITNGSGSGNGLTAGSIALTKVGGGIETLFGTNSYTGTTTINGGTLSVMSTLSSSSTIVVNSSAALDGSGSVGAVRANGGSHLSPGVSGFNTLGGLTMASLNANSINLDLDLATSSSDLIHVTGAATFAGASTINLMGTPAAGTYTILTAGTLAGVNIASFTINSPPTLPHTRPAVATLDTSSPTALKLDVTGGGRNITWTGAQNSNWDYTSQNWTDSIAVGTENFFDGDLATLPDLSDSTKRNITLTTDAQPGSITVFNSAGNDYTISGNAIAGLASLIKSGPAGNAGELVILNNNSYVGGTTISNGILKVGNDGSTGSLGSGSIVNNATLIFDRSDAATFSNAISGTGALFKTAGGTLTFNGASTYTGPTFLDDGLTIATGGALGKGTITIADGAALNLSGGGTMSNVQVFVQGAGPGGIGALGGSGTVGSVTLTGDSTFGGGNGGLKISGGTLDLAGFTLNTIGNNTLSLGDLTVTDGNINLSAGGLGISGNTQISKGTGSINFAPNATLSLSHSSTVARPIFFTAAGSISVGVADTLDSDINFGGTLTFSSNGSLLLTGQLTETGGSQNVVDNLIFSTLVLNGQANYTGSTTINSIATLQLGNGTAATTGNLGSGNVIDNGSLVFNRSNTLTINNNISGSGNLAQIGSGTTILAGALSNTGSINVSAGTLITNTKFSGGTLSITGGFAQVAQKTNANDPNGTTIIKSLSIATGKTLDLTNNSMVIDYTSIGTLDTVIRQNLQSNRIISSTHTSTTTLGYADNALLGLTTFSGVSVDSTSLLIKYTYAGDTNLDGKVDVTDLGALASHWQQTGDWLAGDFNYDGTINVTDLGILASNWQSGVGNPLSQESFQQALAEVGLSPFDLPEPSCLGILLTSVVAMWYSRRR